MPNIWTDEVIDANDLTINAGERITALSSTPFQTATDDSIRVEVQYSALDPDVAGAPFELASIIEWSDGSHWHPLAYQFTPFKKMDIAPERTLIVQPDLSDFNAGIDDIVFVVGDELGRISRHQGRVPKSKDLRVCILLKDYDPGGTYGFNKVTVNVSYELYSV